MTLYTVNDQMQYSGSCAFKLSLKQSLLFSVSVFLKRLECSDKPKISGEQAQMLNLAFHKCLDSELTFEVS